MHVTKVHLTSQINMLHRETKECKSDFWLQTIHYFRREPEDIHFSDWNSFSWNYLDGLPCSIRQRCGMLPVSQSNDLLYYSLEIVSLNGRTFKCSLPSVFEAWPSYLTALKYVGIIWSPSDETLSFLSACVHVKDLFRQRR